MYKCLSNQSGKNDSLSAVLAEVKRKNKNDTVCNACSRNRLFASILDSLAQKLRKPAGRLGVVSPCERSENKEGVWGRRVVDTGAFFGRNRRCLGWRF